MSQSASGGARRQLEFAERPGSRSPCEAPQPRRDGGKRSGSADQISQIRSAVNSANAKRVSSPLDSKTSVKSRVNEIYRLCGEIVEKSSYANVFCQQIVIANRIGEVVRSREKGHNGSVSYKKVRVQ
ncbi:hypothetical protein PsJ27TS7_39720 [Paenibacillus dendritiformis]